MLRWFRMRESEYAKRASRTLTFLFWVVLLGGMAPAGGGAQIVDDEELKLLAEYDLPAARKKVKELYQQRPSVAKIAYLRALLNEDGEEAAELFDEVVLRFRNSDVADRATYRLGQYYFARGLYHSAQKYFMDVKRNYPQSPLVGAARYFAAKAWLASGNGDSAVVELNACARDYPGSWIAALAQEDLGHLPADAMQKAYARLLKYTVQVGAYSKHDNAVAQVKQLQKRGYDADIQELQQGKQKMNFVWVGRFATREEAARFGEEIRKKVGGSYQVVRREP